MLQLPEHELHYHNATALMQDGNYQAAITEVNKAIKLNKNISDYYFLRAYALKHIGQYEQSILDYRFCIYLEPGAADTYNNLGQVYYDTNQYEEAIPWFQQALHINPTLPQALGNLGHIHSARGETRKALQHYYRSVLYNPDYLQAYADLGRFYRNNGRVHRSYHMMEYLLVQYPGYPSFRVERAICASTLHHMMAIDKEELAVAADDMEALYREETAEDAAYLAAELNFSTGNYGRALEYINFALKINPESPLYLNTRGMCYSETVEYNKALADFNTSLKINPALGDTWYNRAISNWRSGAIHEAARDFLKAREEGMSMFPAFRQTLLRFFEAGGLYYQHLVQELPNWATGILALNMQTLQRCDTTNRLLYLLHYETQNRQPEEITPLKQLEMATLFHQYHYPGCIQLYQQYFEAGNIENPAADFYYLYSLYMTRHNRYGEIQELLQQRYSHCTNTNCRGREAFYTAIIYLLCGNEKKAQGLLEQQENMPGVQLLYHMQHPVQPGTLPAGTIPVVYPVNLFSGDAIEPEQLFNLLPAY
ncbi:MAG: tetratricopeptide repeat protein, partial [Dinghuibacter sp.]|nr:tetratricopeptide repeat protein [Dinghuibacter sp.]